jgi:hypothetical protein
MAMENRREKREEDKEKGLPGKGLPLILPDVPRETSRAFK